MILFISKHNIIKHSHREDSMARKFICVQLPEPTDTKKQGYKAGYQTIFDITKARITKSAEKIQTENPDFK
jgi:adenine-specific DNA-methyltransferase